MYRSLFAILVMLVIWNTLVGEETVWVLLIVGPAGSCLKFFSLPNWLSFVPVFLVTCYLNIQSC